MKKIIMMVAMALIFIAPATMAQKVNVESFKSKIEKSNETIAHPKKSKKASTWISRGNIFMDALQEPTKSLFVQMDPAMIKLTCGEPKSTGEKTVGATVFQTMEYPYFTIYVSNNVVAGWKINKYIVEKAGEKALEAYNKAYELDPKQASKIKKGLEQLINYYAQIGDTSNILADYEIGADAYTNVYRIQSAPAVNDGNAMMLYYAGYLYTMGGVNDASLYAKGVEVLNEAVEAGYAEDEVANTEVKDEDKGNIYYYLYHCYYGQKENDPANIQKAKDALIKGIAMFPKNQRIIDALTQLYTVEQGMGDPSELINIIDEAIAANPGNADLWFARGRVFFALKDYDNCIASFAKVTENAPELYDGHFYLGLFYIYKGDALNEQLNSKTYTDNQEYMNDLTAINEVYATAIPILERAHELRPDDSTAVEYLKSLCFRLREEEGIQAKYDKYNELFKSMQAQ